jgi:SnoaL-like domain
MNDSDKLDTLWSAHEIRQLAYRFAQAHDSRDMSELERIFVGADEPLAFPDFNLANVRSTLPAYWRVAGPTMLFVTNHIINLTDGNHAAGSVYCLAKLDIGGSWIEQAILYQDSYERCDGVWLFAKRRHLLWYGIELPERPFDQPKTQWPAGATGRGSLPEEFEAWRGFYGIAEPPSGYYTQPGEASVFA